MKDKDVENVIIIGGGAAGLSAGIYLARAGLAPLIFTGSPAGGQLTLTSEVENYPGYESILGADLIDKMRKQATHFGARLLDENVHTVELVKPVKSVESVKTKATLIATGAKAIWLGLPSEQKLRGKGVSACATCDGFFFKNKTVAVVGGGDTALEEALTLTKFASKVYIIHRRDSFRASKIMQERVLMNPRIQIIWNSTVEEVLGDIRVTGIKLKTQSSINKSTTETLNIDGLFVAIGHKPDTELFRDQIELDAKGYIMTTAMIGLELLKSVEISSGNTSNQLESEQFKETAFNRFQPILTDFNSMFQSMTSATGVFAAGDCVDSVYQQAATAVGMGVAASLDIERWLEGNY
ncbi:MAG: FAD-dependent oxidoreductase [Patescibacteria group bacterium]